MARAVATPFLPLSAVAIGAPDSEMAHERQEIEKLTRGAVGRGGLQKKASRSEAQADVESESSDAPLAHKKYAIAATNVPEPTGGRRQVYTVIGSNVTKHYNIQKNCYVPAVEKLFFMLRSRTLWLHSHLQNTRNQ